jgi:hypothetical protein
VSVTNKKSFITFTVGENITAMEMEFKRLSVGLQTESVSSAVARFDNLPFRETKWVKLGA